MQASHLHIDVAAEGRGLEDFVRWMSLAGHTHSSFSSTDLVVLLGDLYKGTFACHLEWSHAVVS